MDDAQGHLAEFMAGQHAVEDIGDVQLIGTSGTITTLAAVHLGLQRYDRKKVDGITIEAGQTHEIIARLRAKTRDQLAANPCIGHERADLVLAGAPWLMSFIGNGRLSVFMSPTACVRACC